MRPLQQNAKVDALRAAPLFEGLTKKELAALARVTEDIEVEAGTILCKEGRVGHEFFVLVDGSVEVERNGTTLSTRSGGEFVGEIALLATTHRTATVRATTPLRLLVLTRGDFRRVLDENRTIERKVLQALAERLAADAGDSAA